MDDKNNTPLERPIEQIQNLENEDTQKSVSDIDEDSKSEADESNESTLEKENIIDIQSVRAERKKYANKTFWFLWIYISIVIVIVVAGPIVASHYDKDFLESIPLTMLIGTIPASMALFGWVLKGLFPIDKNK